MSTHDSSTFLETLRSDPIAVGLSVFVPVAIAAVQLLNSAVNDLSLAVSVPFAVTLLAFAGFVYRYQVAAQRLAALEDVF